MKLFRFRKKPQSIVRKNEDDRDDLFSSEAVKQVIFDMLLILLLLAILAIISAFVAERYFQKSLPYLPKDSVTVDLIDEALKLLDQIK